MPQFSVSASGTISLPLECTRLPLQSFPVPPATYCRPRPLISLHDIRRAWRGQCHRVLRDLSTKGRISICIGIFSNEPFPLRPLSVPAYPLVGLVTLQFLTPQHFIPCLCAIGSVASSPRSRDVVRWEDCTYKMDAESMDKCTRMAVG